MHLVPPIGLVRRKTVAVPPPAIVLVDAQFNQHTGGSNDIVVSGLTGVLAGDIICCCIGHSGTVFGSPSAAGFTDLFKQDWSNNAAGMFYKVAVGGETSATMTANAINGDAKFGIALVFRNAATVSQVQGGNTQGSFSPRPLGTHTESNATSMSVIFNWHNRTGTADANISVEPVDYTLAARADGSALGGSYQDRILSAWYRLYDNRGVEVVEYSFTPSDFHDSWFVNSRLDI